MPNEQIELRPCPFCGGGVTLEQPIDRVHGAIRDEWWGVVCRNTENLGGTCAIEQRPSRTKEAAIERWNRRAALSAGNAEPGLHPSHKTRTAIDASSFDEICTLCGATDVTGGGWGDLALPCPKAGNAEPVASIPCGGCGAVKSSERCLGCLHDFGTPDSAWVSAQLPEPVDHKRFEHAPCYICGYNGSGYYQPDTHPCAERYHAHPPALEPVKPVKASPEVHRVYEDLHIVFQNDGGPANLRFIEVETPDGKSVRAGRWIKRDGFDVLVLCVHRFDIRSDIAALPPTPEAPHE